MLRHVCPEHEQKNYLKHNHQAFCVPTTRVSSSEQWNIRTKQHPYNQTKDLSVESCCSITRTKTTTITKPFDPSKLARFVLFYKLQWFSMNISACIQQSYGISLYWRCRTYISQDITWKIQQRKYDKGTAWNHWPNDNHYSLSLAWAISSACILFISSSLSILSFWKNKTTISCFRENNHKYNKLQTLTEHEFAFRDVSRFGGQLHIQVMMVFLVETEHKTRVSGHELNGQV